MKIPALLLVAACVAFSQSRSDRFVVILQDPPVAAKVKSRKAMMTKQASDQRRSIQSKQAVLRSALKARGVRVHGAMNTLANAVFVAATPAQAAEIANMPGVKQVVPDMPAKRHMDQDTLNLIHAPQAWNVVGGQQNAGAGIRIAILDTGIDQTHPAFSDASLTAPTGYPLGDTNFTNNKVIVARSYVEELQYFGSNNPMDWRADDISPRDRSGHGTAAAMIAAGNTVQGPSATITGVAPKAFLGNYKIFGTPGVNDITSDSVIAMALEDAYNDNMDVASVSAGSPALWGPSDTKNSCPGETNPTNYCDWRVDVVENASQGTNGMLVVASAGNDGDVGSAYPNIPTYGSIHTPGTAPSAITVGSTYNRNIYYQTLTVAGANFNALFGNGPKPGTSLTAKIIDVKSTGDDGTACNPLPNGSMAGSIAFIARGTCAFDAKVLNAQNAGAVAVVLYQTDSNAIFPIQTLAQTGIPAVLIGKDDASTVANLIAPGNVQATLNPAWVAVNASDTDQLAYFSSIGPDLGDEAIKPEIVAPGTDLYVATQKFDPSGDMYDPSGFTVAQGTSFSAPMVAGAAALVWRQYPNMSPAQVKSAIVNSADRLQDSVVAVGAGRLNALSAVSSTVTVEPAVVSFGATQSLPLPGNFSLTFTNWSNAAVSLSLQLAPKTSDPAGLRLSDTTLQIAPGSSGQVTLSMGANSVPGPGIYEGVITASPNNASTQLRIPYLYVVGDDVPANIVPIRGNNFVLDQNAPVTFTVRVVDRYGVAVPNAVVKFQAVSGGGRIDTATSTTDYLGISEVRAFTGTQLGEQTFTAHIDNPNLTYTFAGRVHLKPSISASGVVNAASSVAGPVAPGSYITIWGRGLSEGTKWLTTSILPYSMLGVSVSFDVWNSDFAKSMTFAARPTYVSDNQINVQVPWELANYPSAEVKVSMGTSVSADIPSDQNARATGYPVTIAPVSPASFEWIEPSGRKIAVAQDANYNIITTDNPAQRGQVILVYANGLGPVDNTPATGEPAKDNPLSRSLPQYLPQVTIGGVTAPLEFSGMTPGSIGLYQLNVRVPTDVAAGYQDLVIKSNGVASKTATLPVK